MFSKKPTEPNWEENDPDFGDLDPAGILTLLFKVPYEKRDAKWEKVYFKNLPTANLTVGEPQIIEGPDGYPYFHLTTPPPGVKYQGFQVPKLKDDFLLKEGIGLAINPAKEIPDWVFSYGDIVNYHLHDEFYTKNKDWLEFNDSLLKNSSLQYTNPPETILPREARDVLRKYLESFRLEKVSFALIQQKENDAIHSILVFHLEPKWFKNKEIFEDVVNSLSWFLPRHYTWFAASPDILQGELFLI